MMVKGHKSLYFSQVCCWHGTCNKSQTTEVSFVTLKTETSLTGLLCHRYCLRANDSLTNDISIAITNKTTMEGGKIPVIINEVHNTKKYIKFQLARACLTILLVKLCYMLTKADRRQRL
jgi:hypothetical protein